MTLQEFIDRAIGMAGAGLDPSVSTAENAEGTAEDLLVTIFSQVSGECAADRTKRSWLNRPVTVAFTNGSATLSDVVLTDYLCESVLYDTADLTARYSHQPDFGIFATEYDSRLGYYHVAESTILVVQPGSLYSVGAGLTGNLTLLTPCEIAIPTAVGNAIVARGEVVDLLLQRMSTALRGKLAA